MSILERIENERRGKLAISHRPDLEGRQHVLVQRASGVMMEDMADFVDYAKVFKAYTWVKKAISVIATNFAPLPVRVVDDDDNELPEHPVSVLLTNANDQMTPPDVWERYVIHKMLGGEVFFEIVDGAGGQPVELWPRRPDQVALRPDESAERQFYPRVAEYLWPDEDNAIDPEHMWHDRFYNPTNQWRGLPPIAAVRAGIVIDLFAQAWSRSFLQRGARPDYAYVSGEPLASSERQELEMAIMDKFGGLENAHRPVILEPGSDVKPLNFAPKDIEWLDQRKFSRDEVGAIFGVPDEIMGYGRDTYENFGTALEVLWTLTIRPLADRRDVSLTHYFTKVRPLLSPGQRVQTDYSDVGVLQEDITPKIEQATKLWQLGVPFNMLDEQLGLGIGSVPGGDIGYLPVNLLPVGPDGPERPDPQPVVVPSNDGDEPDEAPDDEPEQGPPEAPEDEQNAAVSASKVVKAIEYGSTRHKALWDEFRTRLEPHERAMQRELKRRIQAQQNETLRAFREATKAVKEQIDMPSVSTIFNRTEQIRLFASVFQRYYTDTAGDFGEAQAGDFGIDFNLRDPLIEQSLQQATFQFAQQVNETTEAGIRGALSQALEEGLSIPDTQDLLNGVFDGRKSDFETARIARTELSKAASVGNLGAARAAQRAGIRLVKGWLAALDSRTRDSHVAAHQRYQENPIPIEEDFEVGGCSGPGPAQTGCPEEDIMCRCTVVFAPI